MEHRADSLDGLLAEARLAYKEIRLSDAAETYEAAVELAPDSYEAHLGLARTYTRMRLQDEARVAAEQCIALDPQRFEGHAALGVLLFLIDDNQEAAEALQEAIRLMPEDPEAHMTLAQVYADLGDNERSRNELNMAYRLVEWIEDEHERQQLLALYWHAATYQRLAAGRTKEAKEAAQEVLALQEANPYAACLAYSNLGIMEAREKHYDLAIEYLQQAYDMNPFFYRAGSALGRLYIMRNQPVRSAEVLEEVLEYTPPGEEAGTRYAYAMALGRSGRGQEALEQYQLALQGGLRGSDRLLARWQTIWLNSASRNIIIMLVLAATLAWVVLAQPSPQTLTFLGLVVVILILQRAYGRRRQ
jgi:tetratricopeptide (TPR) repeat protein